VARVTDISARRRLPARLPKPLLHLRSDAHLVDMVRGGDDAAFEVLYERHAGKLLAFCGQMLGSHGDADHALRHSFAAARFYIAGGGRDVAFEPWLYTIAGNHCLTLLRDRRVTLPAPVQQLDEWRERRSRRRRLGIAWPVAPAFLLQEGVAAVGGPGVVAKVAVVVGVLAGGAGVTTEAVRQDHGGAAAAVVAEASDQGAPGGCAPGCGDASRREGGRRSRQDDRDADSTEPAGIPRSVPSPSRRLAPRTSSPRHATRVRVGGSLPRPAGPPPESRVGDIPAPAPTGTTATPPVVKKVLSKVPRVKVKAPDVLEVEEDGRVKLKIPPIDRRSLHLDRHVKRLLSRDR
jgi:hypothetical protein